MGMIILYICGTVLSGLLVHRVAIALLNRAHRVAPEPDWLWKAESLLASAVGSVVAGAMASSLAVAGERLRLGYFDPLTPVALFFGTCYAAPICALVGLLAHARWRRHRTPGQCTRCGYDLTGNVTGICPECGLPADQ